MIHLLNIAIGIALAWCLTGSLLWMILLQTDVVTLVDPHSIRAHGCSILIWPKFIAGFWRERARAWPNLKRLWGIAR